MREIVEKINSVIAEILEQNNRNIKFDKNSSFTKDLGFTSLDVAQLVAQLEFEFGVDPFAEGVSLQDVHTVARLYEVYQQRLSVTPA